MPSLKISVDPQKMLPGWQLEPTFQEKTDIHGLTIFLSGMRALHENFGEVVGSSANLGEYPDQLAWYELLERITVLESMQVENLPVRDIKSGLIVAEMKNSEIFPKNVPLSPFQFSKSNGVAIHRTWVLACQNACFELIERHRVLLSWLGYQVPKIVTNESFKSPLDQLKAIYEIVRVDFGQQRVTCFEKPIQVVGVFLYPKSLNHPLILGFGTGWALEDSLSKAENESIQRLGFLWGEQLPMAEPELAANPLFHQDFFLWPENRIKIENWLAGQYYDHSLQHKSTHKNLEMTFIDLSSHDLQHFKVAKAICPDVIPLVFGKWQESEFANLPEDRLIHPIA